MRRAVSLITVAAMLVGAAVALAAQSTPSKVKLSAKFSVSRGTGTKKKPVPVGAGYSLQIKTVDGTRPDGIRHLNQSFEGVRSYGKYFPTCSAGRIAAAQSDKVCPKGSLVGEGPIHSEVGADSDFSGAGSPCDRTTHLYNAGQNKVTVLFVGPGSKCLGTAYTPPYSGYWTNKGGIGGGQTIVNIPPFSTDHPIPGLLVSTTSVKFTFFKHIKKVHGKKISYLMSVGCKGKRNVVESYQEEPTKRTTTIKATAGRC